MESSKVKVRSTRGGALGLLARVLMPLVLVYATWNPSGKSFYHWVVQPVFDGTFKIGPLQVLVLLLLVAGWVIVLQATFRSLGGGGTLLVAGIFATLAWLLVDRGVFRPAGAKAWAHVGLIALSLVLAVGTSWAIVTRKWTGQVEVDQNN
ncbi:MAG TPA: DUF6524 family protein [Gemmatimonadales bacterium]|nr:DUF6524 family protein [Gemmatimonadales bacterium]